MKTVKQIGLIQGGKPVEFAWASAAITTLARTIGIEGYAIESASDETTVIKVHNEAVLQLRKLRDDH